MTGRILRIELRRSPAVWIALLSLVVGTALLLTYPQGFAGRWMQLAMAARTMLTLLWPLALAGGAWLGRRDARSRVGELFASTVRPRWQRVLPTAGALAVTTVTAYLLMFLAGAAWVVPTSGYFPVGALAVTAVGALSLVAAGWLGMAVGRAVPRLITAPALAVVGLALAGLLPDWLTVSRIAVGEPVPSELLLSPVFSGDLDDFETIVGRVNLLQALWLAALAATALLLAGAVRRSAIALATLPAVLGAAVMVPLLPSGGYAASAAFDPEAAELVCADDGPQVCVARVHAGLLPDVVDPARQALAMMAAKLPDPPTRVVESRQVASWAWSSPTSAPTLAPTHQRADALVFVAPSIGPTGRAELEREDFLRTLLEAAWRQECGDRSEHTHVHLARAVAAAWLAGEPPAPQDWWTPTDRELADSAYQRLVSLPEDEQRHTMAAARDDALDCRTDTLRSIISGDVP